jgi:hypothetical protein
LLLVSFGLFCDTCADGADYCLDVRIESLRADGSSHALIEVEDACE